MSYLLFSLSILCGVLLGIFKMKAVKERNKETHILIDSEFDAIRNFDTKHLHHKKSDSIEGHLIHPFDFLAIHYCITSLSSYTKKVSKSNVVLPSGLKKSVFTHISSQGGDVWLAHSLDKDSSKVLFSIDGEGAYTLADGTSYFFYKSGDFDIASVSLYPAETNQKDPIISLVVDFHDEEIRHFEQN